MTNRFLRSRNGRVSAISWTSSAVFPVETSPLRRKDANMKKKRVIIALAAVLVLTVGAAVATPSRGYIAKVLGATTIDSVSIRPDGPSVTLFVRAQIEPDGTTGWHSHPAHVFVLVKQGRVAIIEEGDCTRTVYRP